MVSQVFGLPTEVMGWTGRGFQMSRTALDSNKSKADYQ